MKPRDARCAVDVHRVQDRGQPDQSRGCASIPKRSEIRACIAGVIAVLPRITRRLAKLRHMRGARCDDFAAIRSALRRAHRRAPRGTARRAKACRAQAGVPRSVAAHRAPSARLARRKLSSTSNCRGSVQVVTQAVRWPSLCAGSRAPASCLSSPLEPIDDITAPPAHEAAAKALSRWEPAHQCECGEQPAMSPRQSCDLACTQQFVDGRGLLVDPARELNGAGVRGAIGRSGAFGCIGAHGVPSWLWFRSFAGELSLAVHSSPEHQGPVAGFRTTFGRYQK